VYKRNNGVYPYQSRRIYVIGVANILYIQVSIKRNKEYPGIADQKMLSLD